MAAVAAHPQLVGNAFVSQYYNVLHHSQHVVHRFYTDVSCLTRAECGPEGPVETVYSQNGIYDKIMSVDYSELRAEIKTVDCQDSYSGSVLVMVTGSLSTKAQRRRDFVQTFFLAPQEKGYYVLNDVFRYLDDPQAVKPSMNAVQESAPAPPAAPVANPDERHDDPNESVLAVAEEEIAPEEVYDVPDVEEEAEVEAAPEIEQPSEATRTPLTSSEVEAMPSADEGQGDHPKKSYASILGGPVAQKPPAPAVIEKPMASPSPQATPVSAPAPPPSMDHTEEPENADAANGRSVYVKNLAVTITDSQLEEALHRFGAVKSVSIKRPQNFSYAFVEFEEVSAARAAVEASPIQIDGKTVHIEEKRPMGSRSFRGRGRGRAEGNRGGRNSGGYYAGGGRGGNSNSAAGRGSYSSEAGGSGRGGRGGGYRGSYHSNSNNNSNHNINNNSSSDERYQPQQQQRYENQSQNGGGAQAHQQSSARRKHYRAPFSRSSSGAASGAAAAAAAPSSAVTAP